MITPEQLEDLKGSLKTAITSQIKVETELITASVEDKIEKKVNGSIRNLDAKVTAYIQTDTNWKLVDKLWKEAAQPSIDLGTNLRGFGKVLAYMIATIGALIGLVSGLIAIIKKFK